MPLTLSVISLTLKVVWVRWTGFCCGPMTSQQALSGSVCFLLLVARCCWFVGVQCVVQYLPSRVEAAVLVARLSLCAVVLFSWSITSSGALVSGFQSLEPQSLSDGGWNGVALSSFSVTFPSFDLRISTSVVFSCVDLGISSSVALLLVLLVFFFCSLLSVLICVVCRVVSVSRTGQGSLPHTLHSLSVHALFPYNGSTVYQGIHLSYGQVFRIVCIPYRLCNPWLLPA